MMSRILELAIAVVRMWTRLYTARMPPGLGAARRAEIESDLWEFHQDRITRRGLHPIVHVLVRLVLGIPDDLCWRAAHVSAVRPVRTTVVLTGVVLLLAALWMFNTMRTADLPLPPMAPLRFTTLPPPPPPPAPPARPR